MKKYYPLSLLTCILLAACAQAPKTPLYEGYLCCNIQDGYNWLSDSNYRGDARGYETYTTIPVGMPVKVTGYGRNRVQLEIEGKTKYLGNDYSRDLALEEFAKRWIWAENPRTKMAKYPVKVQRAIAAQKILLGMTKEQVVMALGYPTTAQTPTLESKTWYYNLRSFEPLRIYWEVDLVKDVYADPQVADKVFYETD